MRATVFTDKALARHAGRFVWLSIDTENTKNEKFLEAYPWEAVPTFEVIDPASGKVAYRWLGAVSTKQLVQRFDEAERAMAKASGDDADGLYDRAGKLDAEGKPAEAAAAYAEALKIAPKGWISRGRAAEAMIYALSQSDQHEACAQKAIDLVRALPEGGSRANVGATGLDCALSADEKAEWRKAAISPLEAEVKKALDYDGLLSDDRAGLRVVLIDAREKQGDEAGAKAAAIEFLTFLEADAKKATPEARAALDGFRVSAAIAAGDPARAVPPLTLSEQQLPWDYNPPARLAALYRELGRYDEALAASSRALEKVYGPRKLTVLSARATIFEKQGDTDGAKATLEQALAFAKTLPDAQRPKRMVAQLEKRLLEMKQTP
jgi:tetratricopeptide (TPR) repeat protein